MKSLIISICLVGVVGAVIGVTSWASTTATISATVTARNLAISKTAGGTINYGILDLSAVTTTDPSSDINSTQTFQNDGSQAKFSIMTDDTTGTGTHWSPAATIGVIDEYVHSFATTAAIAWQVLDSNAYETASSTVDSGASLNIYLRFQAPDESTDFNQKTVPVTIQVANP